MAGGLVDLFRSSGSDVDLVVGELKAWNPSTGENEIVAKGVNMKDVPYLFTTDLPLVSADDYVTLLRVRNQYILIGKVIQG